MSYTVLAMCRCKSAVKSDYAVSLKSVTFVIFLFLVIENCKSALPEKTDDNPLLVLPSCPDTPARLSHEMEAADGCTKADSVHFCQQC